MTTATLLLDPDFNKVFIRLLLASADDGARFGVRMLWTALITLLAEHWLLIMGGTIFIFLVLTVDAYLMGRWGSLGSFIYNIVYFGILFAVGLISGPEVFLNDTLKLVCTLILYPICFAITGLILSKMGVRRRFR